MGGRIELPTEEIIELCRKYGLRELSIFGSGARGDYDASSDVDFLYVAGPTTSLSWGLFDLKDELEHLLKRKVDLVPKEYLHWVIRDRVLAEAEVVYEEAA